MARRKQKGVGKRKNVSHLFSLLKLLLMISQVLLNCHYVAPFHRSSLRVRYAKPLNLAHWINGHAHVLYTIYQMISSL